MTHLCRSRLAGEAMVAVMPSSLASQLLQDLRGKLDLWHARVCRSRLAGEAMVAVMPPSLASQLLQDLRGYVGFVT